MRAMYRTVQERTADGAGTIAYSALMFCCPGCQEDGSSGLHMLPVQPVEGKPHWTFNGDVHRPTLDPSILTRTGPDGSFVCHSFLRGGVFEFLNDCTHSLAGQNVPMPNLPDWVVKEA